MTNSTNTKPALTDMQLARFEQLRGQGHTAQRAMSAARLAIGSSDAHRGPRAPFTQFGTKR